MWGHLRGSVRFEEVQHIIPKKKHLATTRYLDVAGGGKAAVNAI